MLFAYELMIKIKMFGQQDDLNQQVVYRQYLQK